ncbi:hypothetical protein [Chitinophaga sp. 22620]|uniref:hypothetical protein n=1 Tax=Chitinophaga sp. 22620 TaxID=3453952 RepID=UPI003F8316D1
MRIITFILIVFGLSDNLHAQQQKSLKSREDIIIDSVFIELDSIVKSRPFDTMFNCNAVLIKKVEILTKIRATDAGGSYVGKILFSLNDYKQWDAWRKKRRENTK